MEWPNRFENLHDLARLPWFSVVDGELVMDPAVGPAIDVHTHLAQTFLAPNRVDLRKDTGKTSHYLPAERGFDMDRYLNQSLSKDDLRAMERDLVLGNFFGGKQRKTHTTANLAREMKGLGVVQSVLLAIDWPIGSWNTEHWLDAVGDRQDLVVFGGVHPLSRNVEGQLDALVARGIKGIKIHPAIQILGPDHPKMITLCRACGDRKLPVLFHCGPVGIDGEGAKRRTQVDRYRAALEACPDTVFVLGHAGALQHERAIQLARDLPNVWVEVASQSLPVVRQLLDEVDPNRICLGSDWPFYHQSIAMAKVLIATEGRDDLRRKLLHDNAARLLRRQG